MILLDTNVLARVTNRADPQCATCRTAIEKLRASGEKLVIVPQNLYEFWSLATRPRGTGAGKNGLGMPHDRARLWIEFFMRRFVLLVDRPELTASWLKLVSEKQILGYKAHDARLAAAMSTYGISQVLTFNTSDFAPLGVTITDPATV